MILAAVEGIFSGVFAIAGAIVGGVIGIAGPIYQQRKIRREKRHDEVHTLISKILLLSSLIKSQTESHEHMEYWGIEHLKQCTTQIVDHCIRLELLLDPKIEKENAVLKCLPLLTDATFKKDDSLRATTNRFGAAARELLRSYR